MDSGYVVCGVHTLCRSVASRLVKWVPSFNVSYRQCSSSVAVVCARFSTRRDTAVLGNNSLRASGPYCAKNENPSLRQSVFCRKSRSCDKMARQLTKVEDTFACCGSRRRRSRLPSFRVHG
jgi:hypothetical protein